MSTYYYPKRFWGCSNKTKYNHLIIGQNPPPQWEKTQVELEEERLLGGTPITIYETLCGVYLRTYPDKIGSEICYNCGIKDRGKHVVRGYTPKVPKPRECVGSDAGYCERKWNGDKRCRWCGRFMKV